MLQEKKTIEIMQSLLPKSPYLLNRCFESDSEVIAYRGLELLYTTDEFSAEDRLRENSPFTLGWNIATGAISDILASGGKPLFYAHSLIAAKHWTEDFIRELSRGIADVLKASHAGFIGGDFGTGVEWRITASVIGEYEGRPMMRTGAEQGDTLYITGRLGSGNVEAAFTHYGKDAGLSLFTDRVKIRFPLRLMESDIIRRYASSCMDTSDGVFHSLNTLGELNHLGYLVENLPYTRTGLLLSKIIGLPKELLFLGECGEYELLFTVSPSLEEALLREFHKNRLTVYRLGEMLPDPEKRLLKKGNLSVNLHELDFRAREFDALDDYLKKLIDWIKRRGI